MDLDLARSFRIEDLMLRDQIPYHHQIILLLLASAPPAADALPEPTLTFPTIVFTSIPFTALAKRRVH